MMINADSERLLTSWAAYSLIAVTLAGLCLMQSAFQHRAAAHLPAGHHRGGAGGRDRPRHGRLRRQHLIGVILMARSLALLRRHRSRPSPGLSCI